MPHYAKGRKCSKCGGKVIIYYGEFCPVCTPKAKIKKNYCMSVYYIEHKYKIETRDYALKTYNTRGKSSCDFNGDHQEKWMNKHYPIPQKYLVNPLPNYNFNQKGMDWCDTPAGYKFFHDRDDAYRNAPDGAAREVPDWDWHLLICDIYEFHNDSWIIVNWQNVYDNCETDWQREITQLFINEFGKRDIKMEFSW